MTPTNLTNGCLSVSSASSKPLRTILPLKISCSRINWSFSFIYWDWIRMDTPINLIHRTLTTFSHNIIFFNLITSFNLYQRLYTENLRYVDRGIEKIENLINDYFKDNQTAFIFTADHGMTDWGMSFIYETFSSQQDLLIDKEQSLRVARSGPFDGNADSYRGLGSWNQHGSFQNAGTSMARQSRWCRTSRYRSVDCCVDWNQFPHQFGGTALLFPTKPNSNWLAFKITGKTAFGLFSRSNAVETACGIDQCQATQSLFSGSVRSPTKSKSFLAVPSILAFRIESSRCAHYPTDGTFHPGRLLQWICT